jgi:hypothetical protein
MQRDLVNQGSSGCLKLMLLHLFGIILACGAWYLMLGRKGILVGIRAYLALISGQLFLKVFRTPQARGDLASSLRGPFRET